MTFDWFNWSCGRLRMKKGFIFIIHIRYWFMRANMCLGVRYLSGSSTKCDFGWIKKKRKISFYLFIYRPNNNVTNSYTNSMSILNVIKSGKNVIKSGIVFFFLHSSEWWHDRMTLLYTFFDPNCFFKSFSIWDLAPVLAP